MSAMFSPASAERIRPAGYALELTGEWLYIFKPLVSSTALYIRGLLRGICLIVSFHEGEGYARACP